MAKKNEKSVAKVSIKSQIDDIEDNAGIFPGTADIAKVFKDIYKTKQKQQKQIQGLDNKVKRIDTRERKRNVVFCLRIA